MKIAFFGTSQFSVDVLNTLKERDIVPDVIVTQPDKPRGRKMILTPPPVKEWAKKIKIFQPEKLDSTFVESLQAEKCDIFILASYGKIIPKNILDLPTHGTLNIHPSLLPHYRGAAPLQEAILHDDKKTGVTIMLMDELMDHGPILAQKEIPVLPWPPTVNTLSTILAQAGAKLLADILPDWLAGTLTPQPQDHTQATFTRKISKADGLLKISDDPYKNFLKIQAYEGWPATYFFATSTHTNKPVRIGIKKATFADGKLILQRIVPEGGKEIDFRAEDWISQ
ncbi:MAG: methionyl-tRNA formyltransferase [Candidatus Pacebacteria bacterium]|nr:methionyl-tRNA formyltransferase [Candidatus Paceibacterota bacterium]